MEVAGEDEPPDLLSIPGGDTEPTNTDAQSNTGLKRKLDDQAQENAKKQITDPNQATASIQTTYIHPQAEEKKKYTAADKAPYIVLLSRTEADPTAGLTIRPIKVGQFLKNNNINNIVRDGLKNVGRNRVSIEFKTAQDANAFISSPSLTQAKYSASIPTYNVTRMGVVRGIPVDLSMEEFASAVEIPEGCGTVIKARRLNRKVFKNGTIDWVSTQSIVVTFSGQRLPSHVYCFYAKIPVETYQLPTIQCLKCCRFGHIKAQCRSKPRCYKCAQEHAGETCNKDPTCFLCHGGSHTATDKNCPEHSRQKRIKITMSQENISYAEASAREPAVKRSYVDMAARAPNTSPNPSHPPTSQTSKPPMTTSYKKTIYINRRPKSPTSLGYDHAAHSDIIRPPQSSLPNGCGLQDIPSPPHSHNDNLLEALLSTLVSIIGRFDDTSLPSNVMTKLNYLFHKFNKIPDLPPMELSEHQTQEN